jgi:phosphoglycerate dehydrogenase-like enzyme
MGLDAGSPFPEPPPWGESVAAERRDVLSRAHVLVALHAIEKQLDLAPNLRWLQGIGAGMEQFARSGVGRDRLIVTNASGMSSGSMAEWVVGRLLQVWKGFRDDDQNQRNYSFERSYGRTFSGSTIGIVGLGNIGVAVSERVRPFGCRVLGLKRSAKQGDVSEHADALYAPHQLHEMLAACDAVVVAAPATEATQHLIDARALSAMKSTAVLVNVARGSLVDESALADAIREKRLGAAVLDVFEQEPLPPESPLWDLSDVYISAHSSVATDRYMDDVFDLVVDNIERHLDGRPLRNLVDTEALGFE